MLLSLLFLTVSRYEDRKSRMVVEKTLSVLISKSLEALKVLVYAVAEYAAEGTKKGAEG